MTKIRIRSIQRWLALGALLLIFGAFGAPRPSVLAAACPGATTAANGWSRITAPTPAQGNKLIPIVAPAADGRILLTSDGSGIFRSGNRGCSWQRVATVSGLFSGADADVPEAVISLPYYVAMLAVPRAPAGPQRVYALLTPGVGLEAPGLFTTQPPVLLAVSKDGGRTWHLTIPDPTGAIPHCANVLTAAVAPTNPDVVYVACTAGMLDSPQLLDSNAHGTYRTGDGGRTWSVIHLPTYMAGTWTLAGDPTSADGVFLLADAAVPAGVALFRSRDRGVHWAASLMTRPQDGPPSHRLFYDGLDVLPQGAGRPARVLMWEQWHGVFESLNGGATWTRIIALPPPSANLSIVGAYYVPKSAEVIVLWSRGPNPSTGNYCQNKVTLVRYRTSKRLAAHLPDPPAGWGKLSWVFGAAVGGLGPVTIVGSANLITAGHDSSCSPASPPPILAFTSAS